MVKSVLDKTKHSVESMITTLDPGMAPYISMYISEPSVGHVSRVFVSVTHNCSFSSFQMLTQIHPQSVCWCN